MSYWKDDLLSAEVSIFKKTMANGDAWFYAHVIVRSTWFFGLLKTSKVYPVIKGEGEFCCLRGYPYKSSAFTNESDARWYAGKAIVYEYEDYIKNKTLKIEKL